MGIPNIHTTIDYPALIEQQANEGVERIDPRQLLKPVEEKPKVYQKENRGAKYHRKVKSHI